MKTISSWDDGTKQDLRIAELVEKHDIPAIFYWPAYPERVNETNGRESLSFGEMANLALRHEVGSHTLTHPLLTRIKPHLIQTEVEYSRKFLQERFSQPINSFCYPRGYANPEIQMAVKQAGYTSARSTIVGYIHESENPYFQQTTVHVGINRKEYAGLDWYDYAIKMLKEAKKTANSVYHLWGHSWEIDKNNAWGQLDDLLSQIRA